MFAVLIVRQHLHAFVEAVAEGFVDRLAAIVDGLAAGTKCYDARAEFDDIAGE